MGNSLQLWLDHRIGCFGVPTDGMGSQHGRLGDPAKSNPESWNQRPCHDVECSVRNYVM